MLQNRKRSFKSISNSLDSLLLFAYEESRIAELLELFNPVQIVIKTLVINDIGYLIVPFDYSIPRIQSGIPFNINTGQIYIAEPEVTHILLIQKGMRYWGITALNYVLRTVKNNILTTICFIVFLSSQNQLLLLLLPGFLALDIIKGDKVEGNCSSDGQSDSCSQLINSNVKLFGIPFNVLALAGFLLILLTEAGGNGVARFILYLGLVPIIYSLYIQIRMRQSCKYCLLVSISYMMFFLSNELTSTTPLIDIDIFYDFGLVSLILVAVLAYGTKANLDFGKSNAISAIHSLLSGELIKHIKDGARPIVTLFVVTNPNCPHCNDMKKKLNHFILKSEKAVELLEFILPFDKDKSFPEILFQRIEKDNKKLKEIGIFDDILISDNYFSKLLDNAHLFKAQPLLKKVPLLYVNDRKIENVDEVLFYL